MRFRLRTLLVVLTLGPPILAGAVLACRDNWMAWLFLLLFAGLAGLWMYSGGLDRHVKLPPP